MTSALQKTSTNWPNSSPRPWTHWTPPRSVGVAGVATGAHTNRNSDRAKRKDDTPQEDDPQDARSPAERMPDSSKDDAAASTPGERSTPQHVDDTFACGEISESTTGPSQASEMPVSAKQLLKRKMRV